MLLSYARDASAPDSCDPFVLTEDGGAGAVEWGVVVGLVFVTGSQPARDEEPAPPPAPRVRALAI
jgi:hypothetical protein